MAVKCDGEEDLQSFIDGSELPAPVPETCSEHVKSTGNFTHAFIYVRAQTQSKELCISYLLDTACQNKAEHIAEASQTFVENKAAIDDQVASIIEELCGSDPDCNEDSWLDTWYSTEHAQNISFNTSTVSRVEQESEVCSFLDEAHFSLDEASHNFALVQAFHEWLVGELENRQDNEFVELPLPEETPEDAGSE